MYRILCKLLVLSNLHFVQNYNDDTVVKCRSVDLVVLSEVDNLVVRLSDEHVEPDAQVGRDHVHQSEAGHGFRAVQV